MAKLAVHGDAANNLLAFYGDKVNELEEAANAG